MPWWTTSCRSTARLDALLANVAAENPELDFPAFPDNLATELINWWSGGDTDTPFRTRITAAVRPAGVSSSSTGARRTFELVFMPIDWTSTPGDPTPSPVPAQMHVAVVLQSTGRWRPTSLRGGLRALVLEGTLTVPPALRTLTEALPEGLSESWVKQPHRDVMEMTLSGMDLFSPLGALNRLPRRATYDSAAQTTEVDHLLDPEGVTDLATEAMAQLIDDGLDEGVLHKLRERFGVRAQRTVMNREGWSPRFGWQDRVQGRWVRVHLEPVNMGDRHVLPDGTTVRQGDLRVTIFADLPRQSFYESRRWFRQTIEGGVLRVVPPHLPPRSPSPTLVESDSDPDSETGPAPKPPSSDGASGRQPSRGSRDSDGPASGQAHDGDRSGSGRADGNQTHPLREAPPVDAGDDHPGDGVTQVGVASLDRADGAHPETALPGTPVPASLELSMMPSYPQILRQDGARESRGRRQPVVPHTLQHWAQEVDQHQLTQLLLPLLNHENPQVGDRGNLKALLSVKFTHIQEMDQISQALQHWLDRDPTATFVGRVLVQGVHVVEEADGEPFVMPLTVELSRVHRWVEAGAVPAPGVEHDGRQRFQGGVRLKVTVRQEGEKNPYRAIVAHRDLTRALSIPSALTGYPGADLAHLAPAAPVRGYAPQQELGTRHARAIKRTVADLPLMSEVLAQQAGTSSVAPGSIRPAALGSDGLAHPQVVFQAANDVFRAVGSWDVAYRGLLLNAFEPNRVRQLLPSAGGWRIDIPTEPVISVGIELRHTSEPVRATLSDAGRSQDVTSHDYEVVGYATWTDPSGIVHSSTVTHRVPRGSLRYDDETAGGVPQPAPDTTAPDTTVVPQPAVAAPAIQPSELEDSLLDIATRRGAVFGEHRPIDPMTMADVIPTDDDNRAWRLLRDMLTKVEDANPGLTFPFVPYNLNRRLREWAYGSSDRQLTAQVTAAVGPPLHTPGWYTSKTPKVTFKLVFTHLGWYSTLGDATPADADDRGTGPFGSARTSIPARLFGHVKFLAVQGPRLDRPLNSLDQELVIQGSLTVPTELTTPVQHDWLQQPHAGDITSRQIETAEDLELVGRLFEQPERTSDTVTHGRDADGLRDLVLDPGIVLDVATTAWQYVTNLHDVAIPRVLSEVFGPRAVREALLDGSTGMSAWVDERLMHVYFTTALQGQPRYLGVDGITVQQGNFTVTAMVERQVTNQRTTKLDRNLPLYFQTLENGVLRFTRPAPQTAQLESTAQAEGTSEVEASARAEQATAGPEQPTTPPTGLAGPVDKSPLQRSLFRHATTRDEEVSGRRPIRHWQLFDLTLDTDVDHASTSIRGMLDTIQAANPGLTFADMSPRRLAKLIEWAATSTTTSTAYAANISASYESPVQRGGRPRSRPITFKVDFSRHAWTTSLSDEVQGVNSEVDPTGPLGIERTNVPAQLQLGAILTPNSSNPPPLRALTQPVALEGIMSVPTALAGPFTGRFEALDHEPTPPTKATEPLAGKLDALPDYETLTAARLRRDARHYLLDPNLIPDLAVAAWRNPTERSELPPAIEQQIRDAFSLPALQRAMLSRNWDTHRGFGVTIEGYRVGFLMEIAMSGERIALDGPEGITVQQGDITVTALGSRQAVFGRLIHSGTMRNGILRVDRTVPDYKDVPTYEDAKLNAEGDRVPDYSPPRHQTGDGVPVQAFADLASGSTTGTASDDRAGDDQTSDDRAGDDRAGDDRAGDDRTGDDRTGDDRAGDDRAGDDRAGDDRAGDDRAGDDRAGDDRAGDDRAGDDRAADDRAADDQTGDNQTGDNQTGDNQTGDNQTSDNQTSDNQTSDNQTSDNQTSDNQTSDNQTSDNQTSDGEAGDGEAMYAVASFGAALSSRGGRVIRRPPQGRGPSSADPTAEPTSGPTVADASDDGAPVDLAHDAGPGTALPGTPLPATVVAITGFDSGHLPIFRYAEQSGAAPDRPCPPRPMSPHVWTPRWKRPPRQPRRCSATCPRRHGASWSRHSAPTGSPPPGEVGSGPGSWSRNTQSESPAT